MRKKGPTEDPQTNLLKDILIVQLASLGVQQLDIRKIVGVDIHRVSRIAKYIKKARKSG